MLQINHHFIKISKAILSKALTSEKIKKLISELMDEEIKLAPRSSIVMVDSEAVAGIIHLKACIHFALKAFKQQNNIAKNLGTEVILYLSGQRQISKAIKKVGVSPASKEILIIEIAPAEYNKKGEEGGNRTNDEFDLEEFLSKMALEVEELLQDINQLTMTDEKKLITNLGISENEIELLKSSGDNTLSREKIIEKIAIEKSALLNIDK